MALLIAAYYDTIWKVEFENVALAAKNSWKEALALLMKNALLSNCKL